MKKTIRDLFLMGVGASSLTRKKAVDVVSSFQKKGIQEKKEVTEIVDRLMQEAAKVKKKLVSEGKKEMKRTRRKVSSTGKKAATSASRTIKKTTRTLVRKGMRF